MGRRGLVRRPGFGGLILIVYGLGYQVLREHGHGQINYFCLEPLFCNLSRGLMDINRCGNKCKEKADRTMLGSADPCSDMLKSGVYLVKGLRDMHLFTIFLFVNRRRRPYPRIPILRPEKL